MIATSSDEPTATQLAQAVQRQELVLHYQPIIAVDGGALIGAEALLRWAHPDLGLLAPVHILALAEAAGLMPQIGDWVLREACRQMHDWQTVVPTSFRLAVNVAASQVGPDFDSGLRHVLADTPLPGGRLEIELTESAAFGDPALFALFDALRAVGVRFAADDFGTGYSCLRHLKCCPITTLKIDQSFVAGLVDDARDRTIVRAVIQLAHGLGMEVVAEGVESPASLEWLRQAGCDAVQGFLFSPPLPADEFIRFVHQRR
ncbi:MAG: Diguanylate phosphodiesterase [Bordetella sp. SCN 67-23]|nr:MAG: Diguanylate phosphodiesterase [Bordetella sp. SCN 67-23]OJX03985.1 MAG: Diguanylate phosphodiesterase [Burkholderiales bacterium 70-64]